MEINTRTEKGGAPELWTKIPNNRWVPYTREGSASVVIGDNFYVFGGIGGCVFADVFHFYFPHFVPSVFMRLT